MRETKQTNCILNIFIFEDPCGITTLPVDLLRYQKQEQEEEEEEEVKPR